MKIKDIQNFKISFDLATVYDQAIRVTCFFLKKNK